MPIDIISDKCNNEDMTNILNEFWNEIKGKKNKSLEGKIFNWLNKDNLGTIIVEGGVF